MTPYRDSSEAKSRTSSGDDDYEGTTGLISHQQKQLHHVHSRQTILNIWTHVKIAHHMRERPEFSDIGLRFARDKARHALVMNRFFGHNTSENDLSWTGIEGGHGIVSITPEHASRLSLPPSKPNPLDPSKHIYILESYHNIHCLRNLRRHYLNLLRGETPDTDMHHDLHCFDSLRQTLMCDADDNLLTWQGYGKVGINQTRLCRDWDALRDWATEYTSCYHDTVPKSKGTSGQENWHKCDGGSDGLPVGSLLG
ncbi:protein of unknown function (DUF3328) domain containing protein [Rhypophila sp. PSN 637]